MQLVCTANCWEPSAASNSNGSVTGTHGEGGSIAQQASGYSGRVATVLPVYSGTSIMRTPLVPSKVSWVTRCPYFGGFRYISGRRDNAYSCRWALPGVFLSSHLLYDGKKGWPEVGLPTGKSTSGFRTTYTMHMKSSPMLKQSHTKTSSPSVYCKRTAPKLLYVAKGLKYVWYYHDDVMRFRTLILPKPC